MGTKCVTMLLMMFVVLMVNHAKFNQMYKGITQLWEAMVCPKNEFDEWQKRKCLFGNCSRCGVETLPLCPHEVIRFDNVLV
jgi:hypothetical protein